VYEVMRTEEAVSEASGISFTLAAVVLLYTVLGIATVVVLRAMSRRWREADVAEDEVPYGPRPPLPEAVESP
jgi:cytochrome d ubiquinol oxidase subunit I